MTLVEQLKQFELKTIQFDGVQQSYREAGQGQALILLHGISSGSGSWVNQLYNLSRYFHVIAWDAPGYGDSDVLAQSEPTGLDYAKRLKGLLDALNLKDVILVGHSLGALQAAAFNTLYPDEVEALVLANLAQGYKGFDAQKQKEVFEKRPKMLEELGASGMAKSRGPHLVAHANADALALIEHVMQGIAVKGFSQASYLLAYDSIQSYLTTQQQATHVLMGMSDGITPASEIRNLANEYQLDQCYEIEDAGHLSYLDQAEQFNQVLLSLNAAQM